MVKPVYIMRLIRWILGRLILLINKLTLPEQGQRDPAYQQSIENQLKNLSLYQFETCPFCVKVRRAMQRLNLPIELRDARAPGQFRTELIEQGGRLMAPCLRIDHSDGTTEWMYESDDIIAYLEENFPLTSPCTQS